MNDRKFLQYNRVRQEHTLHKMQSAKGLFPDFGGKAKSFQSVQSFRISGVQNVQSAKGDLPEIRETLSNPGIIFLAINLHRFEINGPQIKRYPCADQIPRPPPPVVVKPGTLDSAVTTPVKPMKIDQGWKANLRRGPNFKCTMPSSNSRYYNCGRGGVENTGGA